MKLIGWCVKCRKVRQVNVGGNGMAMLAGGSVVHGICDACREAEEQRRKERR